MACLPFPPPCSLLETKMVLMIDKASQCTNIIDLGEGVGRNWSNIYHEHCTQREKHKTLSTILFKIVYASVKVMKLRVVQVDHFEIAEGTGTECKHLM
jgi:hypothetical protein